jgi:drug/metabolite transporter (DMT)-like permease
VPLSCFALVVLAAFIHATWNLLCKRTAAAGVGFIAAYTAIACLAYGPWVWWLLLSVAVPRSASAVACLLGSALLHVGYSLSLQRGYQLAELSVVYPVARGSAPTLSSVAAFTLLAERPSLLGLLGLVGVVVGVVLISTRGDLRALRAVSAQAGLRWGAATGGLIAAYTVVDAYAVRSLGLHPVLLDWFDNLLRLVVLAPALLRRPAANLQRMRGHWRTALAVGVLSPLSYVLVLLAIELGARVSLVAPAREMSMMVGALFGMVLLREALGLWRLAGCLVLSVGVVCLGLG